MMIPLQKIECFILDMDGTLYLSDSLIDGSRELLSLFDEKGIPYFFFTNNSSKSPDNYVKKLMSIGLGHHSKDRIITSGDVTADYIINNYGSHASVYVVGTDPLIEQLTSAGIDCIENEKPDCLVVGFDTSFCYDKAKKAVDLLRAGVPFLATNIDAVCPLEGGVVLPDCASICAMLTHATGRQPKFLGKPFFETADYIIKATKCQPQQIAVVGDRLYTDIRLAADNGMCSVGVLSGEMTKQDIDNSAFKLDYLFNSVKDLYKELSK